MQIQNYDDMIKYINNKITDDEIRWFIFKNKIVDDWDLDTNCVFNILVLQFILAYLKWHALTKVELAKYSFCHSKKAFKLFSSLFSSQKLTLDALIFALSEAQRDAVQEKKNSLFFDLFDQDSPCKYSRFFDKLYDWMHSGTTNEDDLFNMLSSLLKNVSCLSYSNLNVSNDSINITFKQQKYNLNYLIHYDENHMPYFLSYITGDHNKTKYHYICLSNLSLEICIEKIN